MMLTMTIVAGARRQYRLRRRVNEDEAVAVAVELRERKPSLREFGFLVLAEFDDNPGVVHIAHREPAAAA